MRAWSVDVMSRRRFLGGGSAALAAQFLLSRVARAKQTEAEPFRLGLVTPTQTPGLTVAASLYEPIGEAARMGALLAWEQVDAGAGSRMFEVDIVPASAPSAEAAYRAAQRLVSLERVHALIGGLGEGQAERLSAAAQEHQLPFFNIGSSSAALRDRAGHPFTFHLEASATMYLTTLLEWYGRLGKQRWFIVGERSAGGKARQEKAAKAIEARAGELVGTAQVLREQPAYFSELAKVQDADADVILLLINPKDQIAFLAQQEALAPDLPVALFPEAVTQTRDYIAAAQYRARRTASGYRAMLWETTLEAHGAKELNDMFMARWGKPMDSPAWAGYQAVKLLTQAATALQTFASTELVAYLESARVTFDVQKGRPVQFRREDHQLLQPLYVVKVDPQAGWGLKLEQQLRVAELAGEIAKPY